MPQEPKATGWWQTLPGMLTAVAAIITAFTGLLVALNQAGVFKGQEKPAPKTERNAPPPRESIAPHASDKDARSEKGTIGTTVRNSIGMEFVLIPAGQFKMGSPDSDTEADDDEKRAHRVTISQPFYLGKYEVTQAQWEAVMGNNPSEFKGDSNRPVERVSWNEVQEFIRRLNSREGGATYRLPTEAEWEYAARAGTTTRWSFGDEARQLGRYAWYDGNAGGQTHPVGQLQPNPWGLYDMHGNVWEWVQDWYWYGGYASDAAVDPVGPSSGSHRVNRGGCWINPARFCRAADRYHGTPGEGRADLGFRLLKEIQ